MGEARTWDTGGRAKLCLREGFVEISWGILSSSLSKKPSWGELYLAIMSSMMQLPRNSRKWKKCQWMWVPMDYRLIVVEVFDAECRCL